MASPVEPSKDPSRCPPPAVLIEETALENPTPKPSQPTERCEIVINLCFRSLRLGVVCSTAIDNPEPPPYNKVSVIEEIRTQGLCLPIERYFDFVFLPLHNGASKRWSGDRNSALELFSRVTLAFPGGQQEGAAGDVSFSIPGTVLCWCSTQTPAEGV